MIKQKLLIAGGGTGGHIFPGIAIAEEWVRQGGEVVFVGTPAGQESVLIPKYGFPLHLLKVGRLKGRGVFQILKTLMGLPVALFKAMRVIRKEQPQVVLGIGGYASGPATVAARLMCKYTAIIDQNVHPGMTNRFLGKLVKRVFVSFLKSKVFFPENKVVYVGNPVRAQIEHVPYQLPKTEINIFIFGGSQGAVTMNEKFMEALDELKVFWPRLKITHQAGKTDMDAIKDFYKSRGITADVNSFFDSMNDLYAKAHLILCRAGAGTVTEIALAGRPSIMVPYPFAADDHQTKNAQYFSDAGASVLMPQSTMTSGVLAGKLKEFFEDPEILKNMAQKASELAKPQAANDIVTDLLKRGAA